MLGCYTDEHRCYFEKEATYLSEILPDLNFYEYEMLIAFLITVNNLLQISLISFLHQKN